MVLVAWDAMMVSRLQVVMLLFVWAGQAQEFMTPNTDIIKELGKLETMEKQLKLLEETLQRQSRLVEELKNENEARKVAFSASLLDSGSGHTGPFTYVTSPLIYKRVSTNFGNGYDPETGIFTAPLKGVYFFRLYAHSQSGTTMAVSLYKNQKVECSVHSWKPAANANGSNGIVLTLEKGDQIFTKLWDNSWVYDDPAHYTSFGGFLLFPL